MFSQAKSAMKKALREVRAKEQKIMSQKTTTKKGPRKPAKAKDAELWKKALKKGLEKATKAASRTTEEDVPKMADLPRSGKGKSTPGLAIKSSTPTKLTKPSSSQVRPVII